MTGLSASVPPTVERERARWRAELLADLAAMMRAAQTHPAAAAVYSRPAVLARLAALVAEFLPPGTDRLVGAERDAVLLAAVSLHSGIALGVLDDAAAVVHPGEDVVLLAYDDERPGAAIAKAAKGHGLTVLRLVTLFSTRPSSGDAVTVLGYPALRFAQGDES